MSDETPRLDLPKWKGLSEEELAQTTIRKYEGSVDLIDSLELVDRLEKAGEDPASERVIPWTVSTQVRDRDGDVIVQSGINLKLFRKNPVVLWAHDYRQPPIGRALDIWTDDGRNGPRLRMLKQFTSEEENPFGFMIYRLAKAGYLKAASIGFVPTKFEIDQEAQAEGRIGYKFLKTDLLESSVVPVPSNPLALQEAKSVHEIDLTPMVAWAEEILDQGESAGLTIKRKTIEVVREIIVEKPIQVIVERAIEPAPPKSVEAVAARKYDPAAVKKALRSLFKGDMSNG